MKGLEKIDYTLKEPSKESLRIAWEESVQDCLEKDGDHANGGWVSPTGEVYFVGYGAHDCFDQTKSKLLEVDTLRHLNWVCFTGSKIHDHPLLVKCSTRLTQRQTDIIFDWCLKYDLSYERLIQHAVVL